MLWNPRWKEVGMRKASEARDDLSPSRKVRRLSETCILWKVVHSEAL
jgi:hypothetical protein